MQGRLPRVAPSNRLAIIRRVKSRASGVRSPLRFDVLGFQILGGALACTVVFHNVIAEFLAFDDGRKAGRLNGGDVNEDVTATIIGMNETVAPIRVKELHSACGHAAIPFQLMHRCVALHMAWRCSLSKMKGKISQSASLRRIDIRQTSPIKLIWSCLQKLQGLAAKFLPYSMESTELAILAMMPTRAHPIFGEAYRLSKPMNFNEHLLPIAQELQLLQPTSRGRNPRHIRDWRAALKSLIGDLIELPERAFLAQFSAASGKSGTLNRNLDIHREQIDVRAMKAACYRRYLADVARNRNWN